MVQFRLNSHINKLSNIFTKCNGEFYALPYLSSLKEYRKYLFFLFPKTFWSCFSALENYKKYFEKSRLFGDKDYTFRVLIDDA